MATRRKCFISYHHADQDEVNNFIKTFDHNHDIFIARGLGEEMSQDIIDSTDTDYVMSRIRQLYLSDSTVTIVMLGKCTWARRYVDWEIQSSLRSNNISTLNGLLGVKLKSFPEDGNFPNRFNLNLNGTDSCYARHIGYPNSPEALLIAIEAAFQRRTTHNQWISNPRESKKNCSPC